MVSARLSCFCPGSAQNLPRVCPDRRIVGSSDRRIGEKGGGGGAAAAAGAGAGGWWWLVVVGWWLHAALGHPTRT